MKLAEQRFLLISNLHSVEEKIWNICPFCNINPIQDGRSNLSQYHPSVPAFPL